MCNERNYNTNESNTSRLCDMRATTLFSNVIQIVLKTKHIFSKSFLHTQRLCCNRPILYSSKTHFKPTFLLKTYFSVVQSFDILHSEQLSRSIQHQNDCTTEMGAIPEIWVQVLMKHKIKISYTDHKYFTKHVVVCVRIFCIEVPSEFLDFSYPPRCIIIV